MKLVDVIQEKEWQAPLLEKLAEFVETDEHHNTENYRNFGPRLERYDMFNILLDDDDEILAMSGLLNAGIWPKHLVRGLDRTLYFNWTTTMGNARPDGRYSSTYFWPAQRERAAELGYKAIFFSIQNPGKRRVAQRMAERTDALLLDDLYNTCPLMPEINQAPVCWQNVILHEFEPCDFELPSITREEYDKKYKDAAAIR